METKTITLPKTVSQVFEYSLIASSFLIPFLISGPQLLTGTIVNSLFYLFVLQSVSKKILPIVLLPSIGALLNGIIFGKFTVFLLYFLPMIWISNYLLIHSFKFFLKKKSPVLISMGISALLKTLLLFSIAYLFTTIKIVPQIFLQLMGLFQLYTALLGGVIALGIHFLISKKNG